MQARPHSQTHPRGPGWQARHSTCPWPHPTWARCGKRAPRRCPLQTRSAGPGSLCLPLCHTTSRCLLPAFGLPAFLGVSLDWQESQPLCCGVHNPLETEQDAQVASPRLPPNPPRPQLAGSLVPGSLPPFAIVPCSVLTLQCLPKRPGRVGG